MELRTVPSISNRSARYGVLKTELWADKDKLPSCVRQVR
jgi:hypothetical protein